MSTYPKIKTADADFLAQKELVEQFLSKTLNRLSGFSFVNIFAWKDFFHFEFEMIDGNLCIFAENEIGMFMYLPPLGEDVSPTGIEKCFARMEAVNKGKGVSRIENVPEDQLSLYSTTKYIPVSKGQEYCYLRQDLVDLKGNAYKDKRALYNFCVKNFEPRYKNYDGKMLRDCSALYERWAESKLSRSIDDISRQMIEDNRQVHRIVIENSTALGLVGRVVEVNGVIAGYTFGYPLNDETFCILFEIVDLKYKGLPVYIFKEFCHDTALECYKFINVMDDFALPNLEKTKLSFRPTAMVPAYNVKKRCTDFPLIF